MAGKGIHTLLMTAVLGLFVLVFYVGARIVLTEWGGRDLSTDASKAVREEPAERPSPLTDRRPIQSFQAVSAGDVFRVGRGGGPSKPEEPRPVLQETRLNIRLKGTVVGHESASYAMVLDGLTLKEEIYRVDEYIQGVRIEDIQRDGVVLQGPKGREFLRLDEPAPATPGRGARATALRPPPAVPKKAEP